LTTTPDVDVIIAGSGPAGATAATLLAQKNHSVLVIERDQHPRFHIGESMLPLATPVLERLGVQLDEQQYLPKSGAEFIHERSDRQVCFSLNTVYQPYQVERSRFDHLLIGNAVTQGASLKQNESIQQVAINSSNVKVKTSCGNYSARYFIDATGRSAFTGIKRRAVKRIDNLGRFALYTHYHQPNNVTAHALHRSGNIKVLMVDIGWIWVIPLIGQRLSIGLVVQRSLDKSHRGTALYNRYIGSSPFLTKLLVGAIQEREVRAEADFSFINTQRHGERYACCGDAAGFLDPIFSSGVFFAITSAERVADRLHPALVARTEGDINLHTADDVDYDLGFNSMRLFVERFYRYDMVSHLFFEADRNEAIKNDIAALLSGDLWRSDNSFQGMLLRGRQKI
jgi:flavin-dependent dehydrogenase